jgi:predicted metalloprotease with PDZ domain
MTNPHSHLYEITMTISDYKEDEAIFKMAVWTPGSYLIREYSRHVEDFQITAEEEKLDWKKITKNSWKVKTKGKESFQIKYNVYAFELTVRTAYLDGEHGFYNGACLFMFLKDHQDLPVTIDIQPYKDWIVSTPLKMDEKTGFYLAKDFNEIVDSPVECGTHSLHHFQVFDTPHEVAIFGEGNFEPNQVVNDLQKIVEEEAQFFGGVPYDRYVFIIHFVDGKGGGLEHKNCNVSIYPAHKMRKRDDYLGFLGLESHEFFHTWNVKRLRPAPLGPFDYENENYTRNLWLSEGWTSYYQDIILTRAELMEIKELRKKWGELLQKVLTVPGRFKQSAAESSFDAWIKLYRRDENTINSTISYYSRGALNAGLGFDLWLRHKTNNEFGLDKLLIALWKKYGEKDTGFPEDQIPDIFSQIVGFDVTDYYSKYIDGTNDIPLDWFNYMGLKVKKEVENVSDDKKKEAPYIGCIFEEKNNQLMVKSVLRDSPAEEAGIYAGDEILAFNGLRLTKDKLKTRILDFEPKQTVDVTLFRFDQLYTVSLTLGQPVENKFTIELMEDPDELARNIFKSITGQNFPEKEEENEET